MNVGVEKVLVTTSLSNHLFVLELEYCLVYPLRTVSSAPISTMRQVTSTAALTGSLPIDTPLNILLIIAQ